MANTKSAIKRIRRISRQTAVNRARKSKFKNAIKKMNLLIESKKKKDALKFLPKLNSELMKVAKTFMPFLAQVNLKDSLEIQKKGTKLLNSIKRI